ncbi:tetratricopeptide repeat protein [Candidatus Uabimicrobium amorphum]|uniref:Tetratricopeptide repeat domain protein n=1 Tax=Uabimicrobium amorphum TaxID=2596890 RepID=A0A5S9IPH0_UABAM|nr:tetratricopeptide repeat protein [Candidatus Uabimicrobium amorphum]BBM85287.1 tetratricopeptide repeat domain protein [Candidatus Uabimicrobium amorphum]
MQIYDWIINYIYSKQKAKNQIPTSTMNIIGREAELAILEKSLKEASSGQGNICVVYGESGYGKTFLLEHFFQSNMSQQKTCFLRYNCCDSISQHIAFEPLIKIFCSPPKILTNLKIDFPTPLFFKSNENLKTLYFKIASLLKKIAQHGTVVLCIDNAHYCDNSTLDFFKFFSREVGELPIQIILCFDEVTEKFSGTHKSIHLTRLSNSLAMNYLHQRFFPNTFSYEFMNKFAEVTAGSPFFWNELAALFVDENVVVWKNGVWNVRKNVEDIYFPEDCKEILQERLRLKIRCKRSYFFQMKCASVLGQIFSLKNLEDIRREKHFMLPEKDLFAALPESTIHRGQIGQYYRFKNILWKQFIYERIEEEELRGIHHKAMQCFRKHNNALRTLLPQLIYHSEKAQEFSLFVKYCYLAAKEEKKKLAYANAIFFCRQTLPHLYKEENVREKYKVLSCLSACLIKEKKLPEAKGYLLQILNECEQQEKDYTNALFLLADIESLEENFSNSLDYLQQVAHGDFSENEQKIIAINRIVQLHLRRKEFQAALDLLGHGEEIALKLDDQRFLGAVLYNLAKCLLQKGDLQAAFDVYHRCIEVYQKDNNLVALVQCYNFIAHIYSLQGLINDSIEFYEKTMNLLEQIDAQEQRVKVELDFAQVLLQRRFYKRTENLLENSYKYYKNAKNMSKVAVVLSLQGKLYVEMGNFRLARKKLEESIEINRVHRDIVSQAMCVENIGIFFLHKGQWEKAKPKFEKSALIWEVAGMRKKQVMTLNSLGDCYWHQKENNKAVVFFERSLAICQDVFPDYEAQTLNKLAKIYCFECNWEKAHESLEKSIAIQTKLGVLLERCCTYTILGHLHLKQGNFTDAETQYLNSYEIHDKLNDLNGKAQDILHIGRMHLVANRVDDAQKEFYRSLQLYEQEENVEMQAMLHEQLARGFRKLQKFDEASAQLEKALSLKQDLPEWKMADTYYGFGRCALFAEELEQSISYFHKGLELYQKIQDRYKISKILNNIGEVLIRQGYYLLAMEHFAQSYILKENMQDVEGLAYTHMHIGRVYMRLNRMDKATENFEKSVVHWKILGHDEYVAELSYQLGELYEREAQIEQARNNFTRAYHFFKNINRKRLAIIDQKLEELE